MSAPARLLPRLRPLLPILARPPRNAFITIKSQTPPDPIEPADKQSHPLGAYYESILNTPQPIPDEKPEEPPQSSIPKQKEKEAKKKTNGRKPKEPTPSAEAASAVPTPPPQTAAERALLVFGSALDAPAKRAAALAEQRNRSTLVAGVLVPPQPEEPDNCCMSGCVHCTWDTFREDMEAWSSANALAQKNLAEQNSAKDAASETKSVPLESKIAKDMWDDSLYQDIPVGIREFMKMEKKLKDQHR